ncbi:hypothetical protein [Catenovulum adriaticum]|uniref:YqjK-like protein n=1 Tax=Catenovulum adriaticum TaxID=2984846 RepID=A0ABY7AN02_9ALTE|nr:hypothetical protein [Catenovulum sp. TS8]WAJ69835.1 hypothetical protein OLW01_11840 [Catenovulum sp. TS8]
MLVKWCCRKNHKKLAQLKQQRALLKQGVHQSQNNLLMKTEQFAGSRTGLLICFGLGLFAGHKPLKTASSSLLHLALPFIQQQIISKIKHD